MKVIQIFNSIKLQSLKPWHSLICGLSVVFFGCNPTPEACLDVSASSVQVGERIVVSDCSQKSHNNTIDMGDGARFLDQESVPHSYFVPGAYAVQLTAFSKKGDKTELAGQTISVSAPSTASVLGSWKLSTVDTYEQLELDPTISLFDYPKIKSETFEETWNISEKEIQVAHISEDYFIFENVLPYSYSNGVVYAGNTQFRIVRQNSSQMIWKGYYFKGFKLIYLSK